MAEEIDSQAQLDDESESLRKTLEQMRKEAEEEVTRLNDRLAERDFGPDSSIASATERLAMQQEMMLLQQTLEAKEQALDHITEECRRLEDELEDQNIAYDGLKQEIDRKESALRDARGEIDRLRQELFDANNVPEPVPPPTPEPVVIQPVSNERSGPLVVGILALFVLLLLVSMALVYTLWQGGALPWAGGPAKEGVPIAAIERFDPGDAPDEASRQAAEGDETTGSGERAVAVEPDPGGAAPPRVHRDRLQSGGTGPTMVMLSGGAYRMGYNSLSGQDFSPAHEVTSSRFMIGSHEVTFDQYDRFARATGRELPDDHGWGRGQRPVIGVSWEDARAYTAWLSDQTSARYRLPTEAEWELAARAGTQTPFWWGFGLRPGRATCFDCGTAWDNRSTAPVKSFEPNPYGLYDTAGNVMEWVEDCYSPSYQGAPSDGSARHTGDCLERVARGGAFNKPGSSMRSFVRAHFAPDLELNMLGFRVARDF